MATAEATYPSLAGRVVFVTGGGSGIGASIVEAFARQRSKVAFVDVDEQASALVQSALSRLGAEFYFERCDVRDTAALRRGRPQGGPGMPEWGMLPIPMKLVRQGVRDMVRISDARMSGTSYGACVLHVSPEAYVGGLLALVRTGDRINLDVAARTINLDVSSEELSRRRAAWSAPPPHFERGYGWMFTRHIRQAHEGCDFDFLETGFGAPIGEPAIF